jgi:hypothetical protein
MQTFNIPPSKMVGDLKDMVREAILDGIIPNDYDSAFEYMMLKANELKISKP